MSIEKVTAEELLNTFKTLNIEFKNEIHEPVFTVEEAKALRANQPTSGQSKNLYLRDKKKKNFLLTAHEDADIDLADLPEKFDSKRLSFGSPDRLMENLGVIPGAVSPFALVNDTNRIVEFWIDQKLMETELMYFHPLDNSMTTAITPNGLRTFLEHTGHELHTIELS